MLPYGVFGYEVGSLVQLRENGTIYEVRWRGWVFVPTPGGRRREAAYWLGPGHWDCYYEERLKPIGQRWD